MGQDLIKGTPLLEHELKDNPVPDCLAPDNIALEPQTMKTVAGTVPDVDGYAPTFTVLVERSLTSVEVW